VRRRVGGTIWEQEIARVERAHEDIKRLVERMLDALNGHPVSVRLLAMYLAKVAISLNDALTGIREIRQIAQDGIWEEEESGDRS
jgi:hypothetical protein